MATRKQKQIEQQQRDQSRREITGVCFVALGLFLAVSIYSDAVGVVGSIVSDAFFALFGLMGFAVPVLTFAAGILTIVFSGRETIKSLYAVFGIGFLCLLVILHIYSKADIKDVSILAYIKEAYQFGRTEMRGGGVCGAVIAYPSLLLIGEVGTYILFFTLEIVMILLVTRISLRSTGEKVGKKIKSGVENAKEHIEQKQVKAHSPQTREQTDLFSDDLFKDLMEESPKQSSGTRRKKNVTRPSKQEKEMLFDLHLEDGPADIGIQDMGKVRFADDDLSFMPSAGRIEKRRETNIEQDLEDMISLMGTPPAAPEQPEKVTRRSRISENAPCAEELKIFDEETEIKIGQPEKVIPVPDIQPVQEAIPQYQFPPVSVLKRKPIRRTGNAESPEAVGKLLIDTLNSFNISAKIINISVGPVITRFELQPAQGIRVSRITTLSNDIALALAAPRVRIEAPIPGKAAVGIEIPNKSVTSVFLREVLEAPEFAQSTSPITFALGKDIAGKNIVADLAKMPHLLIAGATGSGKSVCINDIIISMTYKSSPEDVRMILIDPKVVELKVFSSLPHLYLPVVTEPKKAAGALKWAVMEMEQRYQKMSQMNARDITRFNSLQTDPEEKMPYLVIVIDELADLMMVAAKDVEESICRIAQLGRACGIHLIVATQRPSADIITGLIKANIPSRIAFMVSSAIDSRVIMDCSGAEKLLGKGDMIFHPNGADKPVRVQGAFVSDEEAEAVMEFFQQQQAQPKFKEDKYIEAIASGNASGGATQGNGKQEDELLPEAVRIVLESGQASISMIQRRLRVGYARAARLVDIMEQHKIVSGFDGSKPRKLLISSYDEFLQMNAGAESGNGEIL